jgi:hypothetical protein
MIQPGQTMTTGWRAHRKDGHDRKARVEWSLVETPEGLRLMVTVVEQIRYRDGWTRYSCGREAGVVEAVFPELALLDQLGRGKWWTREEYVRLTTAYRRGITEDGSSLAETQRRSFRTVALLSRDEPEPSQEEVATWAEARWPRVEAARAAVLAVADGLAVAVESE